MTDDLIDRLAKELRPVPRLALLRFLILATMAGIVIAAMLMLLILGPRPDLRASLATAPFWIKSGYTFALALLGFWATERLSRPATSAQRPFMLMVLAVALIAGLAAFSYGEAPPELRPVLLFGSSALLCPFYIAGLSLPLLGIALATVRRLAPTSPMLAGAAAGLLAGSFGAWVYSFHCTENGIPFLALWYTLGILFMVAIGAIAGRYMLRW